MAKPVEFVLPSTGLAGLEPDPVYRELRGRGPVRVRLPFGAPAWLVTSYEQVKTVLSDPRFSRAHSLGDREPRAVPTVQRANLVLNQDAPEHGRLRQLVAKAFTKRGVERLRPAIDALVAELLDDMKAAGPPADLVTMLAAPLPALVMCELLGVPHADRDTFVVLTHRLLAMALAEQSAEQTMDAGRQLWSYLNELVELRRREPDNGLLSDLLLARDGQRQLSEEELTALCVTLVIAGHDATTMQIGNFTYQLLRDPARFALLRQRPELIDDAVEELMRYSPLGISTAFPRLLLADLELGGVHMAAGEYVVVALTAANRDEAVFSDAERIDFTRQNNAHLGFGYGMHRCLGAQLALLELRTVLRCLVSEFPGLALAVADEEIRWSRSLLARSAVELLVTW